MTIEGVDYSRTAGSDWVRLAATLQAQGKTFAGRYVVNDHSPNGRGLSADEYAAYVSVGLDVFVYWESSEGWMLNGDSAGISAAVNAQQNINAAGLPPTIPVYFAADFDFTPKQQADIDDCLRGCAKVLGPERIGIYGGFHVLKRCKENGTARWFCQTLAWSGGNLLEGVHLYQYDTQGNFIAGTDCDLVRAYQDNYGQASKFLTTPVDPIPEPQPPSPEPFPGFAHGLATGTDQHHDGTTYQYIDRLLTVRKGRRAPGYTKPGGTKIVTHTEGWKIRSAFVADIGCKQYVWDREGFVYSRSPFSPKLTLQRLT